MRGIYLGHSKPAIFWCVAVRRFAVGELVLDDPIDMNSQLDFHFQDAAFMHRLTPNMTGRQLQPAKAETPAYSAQGTEYAKVGMVEGLNTQRAEVGTQVEDVGSVEAGTQGIRGRL